MKNLKRILIIPVLTELLFFVLLSEVVNGQEDLTRQQYLQRLMKVTPADLTKASGDQLPGTPPAHVSPKIFCGVTGLNVQVNSRLILMKCPHCPFCLIH